MIAVGWTTLNSRKNLTWEFVYSLFLWTTEKDTKDCMPNYFAKLN